MFQRLQQGQTLQRLGMKRRFSTLIGTHPHSTGFPDLRSWIRPPLARQGLDQLSGADREVEKLREQGPLGRNLLLHLLLRSSQWTLAFGQKCCR